MQNLNNAKVEGNRFDVGEWFIIIHPYDESDLVVQVRHKTDGRKFAFDSLETAVEAIK